LTGDEERERNREIVRRYFTTDPRDMQARLDAWADDGIKEFAWAPAGVKRSRWAGREELIENAELLAGMLEGFSHVDMTIYGTDDPATFWITSRSSDAAVKHGRPFPMRYVHFVQLRDAKLILHREYFDSELMAAAVAGNPE
jgi:ketosteroid isomerase-like protein